MQVYDQGRSHFPPNFSGLFLKVLHRPLTAPLVAKLTPPVAPPNENVWLRPCLWRYGWIQQLITLLYLDSSIQSSTF